MKIGDLWNDFLESSPAFARRLAEAKLSDAWVVVAGQAVAYYTTRAEVKNGVATIYISSSVIRSEVFMRRELLRQALNTEVGYDVFRVLLIK